MGLVVCKLDLVMGRADLLEREALGDHHPVKLLPANKEKVADDTIKNKAVPVELLNVETLHLLP